MSEQRTLYLQVQETVTAVQVPHDLDGFCSSFNHAGKSTFSSLDRHVWSDGKRVHLVAGERRGSAEPGDWIITTSGKESVQPARSFRRCYLPISSSVLDDKGLVR